MHIVTINQRIDINVLIEKRQCFGVSHPCLLQFIRYIFHSDFRMDDCLFKIDFFVYYIPAFNSKETDDVWFERWGGPIVTTLFLPEHIFNSFLKIGVEI